MGLPYGRGVYCYRAGVFCSLRGCAILAAKELGLGLWTRAYLHRVKQRLLFAGVYSVIDPLAEA